MLPIVQIFFFFNLNFFWTQPTSENLQNVVLFKVLFQLQFQFRLVCFQPRATPSFLATLKKRSTVNEPWPVEHFLVGSTGWLVIIIISQLSLSVCLSLSRQEDQTFHLHPICIFSFVLVMWHWPPPTHPSFALVTSHKRHPPLVIQSLSPCRLPLLQFTAHF